MHGSNVRRVHVLDVKIAVVRGFQAPDHEFEGGGGYMDFLSFDYTLLIRLVVAVIFGGLIGLERAGSHHEAGLRTHIIVCLGSATVMIVSESLVKQYGGDILRMGSQVISGIGFLGAGSIIVHGSKVKGITTAAGVWTTACVGLAVGSAYYVLATAVVLLLLFAMWCLRPLTSKINAVSKKYMVKVHLSERAAVKEILHMLMVEDVIINSVVFDSHGGIDYAVFEITPQKHTKLDRLTGELAALEGVKEFSVI